MASEVSSFYPNFYEPIVQAKPAYRGHVLKFICIKPKSLPEVSRGITVIDLTDLDGRSKATTPYRLPRITPPGPSDDDDDDDSGLDRVWGRFGFENTCQVPSLSPAINRLPIPRTAELQPRSLTPMSLAVPRHAPSSSLTLHSLPLSHRDVTATAPESPQKGALLSSSAKTAPGGLNAETGYEEEAGYDEEEENASPFMSSRVASPTKSTRSIHWVFGCQSHSLFDRQGRGRKQGPYSREFPVTCGAPSNWMKMKWGRSKTMVP